MDTQSGRDYRGRFSEGHKQPIGFHNKCWKGVNATYSSVHWWIRTHWKKPGQCERCHTKNAKRYDWANISGLYKRERNDWLYLCVKCHHKYDNSHEKAWDKRRKLYGVSGSKRGKGYSYEKAKSKYRAMIQIKGKRIHLGYFEKERDASKAYQNARLRSVTMVSED